MRHSRGAWTTITAMLLALSWASPGSVRAQEAPAPIRIETVGSSFRTGEDGGTYTHIYSLVIGSPEEGERQAFNWSSRFGMHALDGTLWVRAAQDDVTRWKRVTLRRPRSAEDGLLFATRPAAFQDDVHGDVTILPPLFSVLGPAELLAIDYIVTYASGGTRALLRVGTTERGAQAVVDSLALSLRAKAPTFP